MLEEVLQYGGLYCTLTSREAITILSALVLMRCCAVASPADFVCASSSGQSKICSSGSVLGRLVVF